MRSQRGFSLLELSIALIIIGIIMVPIFEDQRRQIIADRVGLTLSNMSQVVPKSIDDFYFKNLRYPCPSDPSLNEADANFGIEDCTLVSASNNQVLIGSVPFKALGIKAEEALDGYSNKLSYNVTRAHTVANGPTSTAPILSVLGYQLDPMDASDVWLDAAGNPVVINYTPQGAGYVIISHGPSGVGAFTADGVALTPCPTAPPLTRDSENCDGDKDFFNSIAASSYVEGTTFYDDKIHYQGSQPPSRIFVQNAANTALVSTYAYYGINNDDPQVEVDVNGTTLAEGNTHAIKFCTEGSGTDCFQASMIGGVGISCTYSYTANEVSGFMTGIAKSNSKCIIAHKGVKPATCASGEYISGIGADGGPICKKF